MIDYKSFKLADKATLRIRTEKIIATVSSKENNIVDIYCSDKEVPFHVQATKHTSDEILDYVWGKIDDNEETM